ncbi:MAG TPA: zinc ribbon domain-containing protein [Clostridiaceae bacterium]|nr:zinc ribbon domain-containing protein [Clostridiaceae bacterium]
MPFYDLKCDNCNEEFNVMAKMSEREQKLIKCPKCGSNELSPVFKNLNYSISRKNEMAACPNAGKCGNRCGLM